jgi:hypothetical protein
MKRALVVFIWAATNLLVLWLCGPRSGNFAVTSSVSTLFAIVAWIGASSRKRTGKNPSDRLPSSKGGGRTMIKDD